MLDDQPPIEMVSELLLPVSLRGELCITGLTVSGDQELLSFRIDPGSAFERHGYVRSGPASTFLIGISERYLPDSERIRVCGSDGVTAGDVPDQLRTAAGWAYTRDAARDHWRDVFRTAMPTWSESRGSAQAVLAIRTAALRALERRGTAFVFTEAARVVFGSEPPGPGRHFCSVTRSGNWSLHQDRVTYPLEIPPDAKLIRTLGAGEAPARTNRPVALVVAEHPWAAAGVVVPFRPRQEPDPEQLTRSASPSRPNPTQRSRRRRQR